MKQLQLLFLAFFIIHANVHAQSDNFRFKKLLQEAPSEKVPFAIPNKPGVMAQLLAEKDIIVKQASKNWIFIQASPQWIYDAQKNKKIESFYFEFSNGQPLNDSTRAVHHVNEAHAGLGGLQVPFTGKGVIIGFVDEGLDYTHPDFLNPDGTTRVTHYWDQNMPFNASRTPSYGYGQLFYASDINSGNCPAIESGTAHGTTVAGAAAANGSANGQEKGMAPDCKIIVIQTNFNMPNWTLTVADACDLVFAKADSMGLPAIVNLSVGSYLGSHDGEDPAGELINNLLDEHPGRLVVCAAGNSGNWGKYHVQGNVTSDTSFVWIQPNPGSQLGPNTCYMDVWTDLSDATFKYAFAANLSSGSFEERAETQYRLATFGAGTTIYDTLWNNGNRIATVQAFPEIVGNNMHIEYYFDHVDSASYYYSFKTVGSGKYDAWTGSVSIALNDMVTTGLPTSAVYPDIVHYNMPDSLQTIVSSWACSDKVITVANFKDRLHHINANGDEYSEGGIQAFTPVGHLSVNSSKGPSRHGSVKPDIGAAGDVALSAGPLDYMADPGNYSQVDQDMMHMRNGGTSMASPVIAGIAALYLEKCKNGTYQSFKNDLTATAYGDMYTGTLPNYGFGYGKAHALNLLLASNYPSFVTGSSLLCINDTLNAVSMPPLTSAVWSTSDETLHLPVPTGGDYWFKGYNNLGCISYSDTMHVTLLTPAPIPTITSDGGNYLITSDYPDLQWYLNGVIIPGATNDSLMINVDLGGDYTVVATSVDGCSRESSPYTIGMGINEESNSQFVLYPNPAQNSFEVKSSGNINGIVVTDLSGKLIMSSKTTKMDCSTWSRGTYLVQISSDNGVKTLKFIKE